jgi:hypothetical protein
MPAARPPFGVCTAARGKCLGERSTTVTPRDDEQCEELAAARQTLACGVCDPSRLRISSGLLLVVDRGATAVHQRDDCPTTENPKVRRFATAHAAAALTCLGWTQYATLAEANASKPLARAAGVRVPTAACAAVNSGNLPTSRLSRDGAPTRIDRSPSATTHPWSGHQYDNSRCVRFTFTWRCSPGASSTLTNPASVCGGDDGGAAGARSM